MEIRHFEHLRLDSRQDVIGNSVCMCLHCGKLCDTGIFNLLNHLDSCEEYQKKIIVDFSNIMLDF